MLHRDVNERQPDRQLSHHILPTAATMVGICPTLISLVKLIEANGVMRQADEVLGVITVVFVISALMSYSSIRGRIEQRYGMWLERVADLLFIIGLVSLAAVSVLFAYEWV